MNQQHFDKLAAEALKHASTVIDKQNLKSEIKTGLAPIDIYKLIIDHGISLLFRPLENILGAYIPNREQKGILISSSEALSVARQRYTAAHELGHFIMNHKTSVDSEEHINRAQLKSSGLPDQEILAELFASQILMPKALLVNTAKAMGLKADDFIDPINIYQLSLRLGTSYLATCLALKANDFFPYGDYKRLSAISPKTLKQQLLDNSPELENGHLDVVVLSERDHGRILFLKPGDRVILNLQEHALSGYQWISDNDAGIEYIRDDYQTAEPNRIGKNPTRVIELTSSENINLELKETRTWDHECTPINTFELNVDFRGREEGLPRCTRSVM